MKYPFRYYGREPADWSPSAYGFLYDVQFAKPVDDSMRAALKGVADRFFSEGPSVLGDLWCWSSDGCFLVFAVKERYDDSARQVFTQLAEIFSVIHQIAPIRDVVFCNGVGSRADRWDAWSMSRSAEPDAGPARPNAPWARLLRRPVDATITWEIDTAAPAAAAAPMAAPASGRARSKRAPMAAPAAPPPLAEGAPSVPQPRKKKAPEEARWNFPTEVIEDLPERYEEDAVQAGWERIEAAFSGEDLIRIDGPSVPVGWLLKKNAPVAIVCLNGMREPQRLELPKGLAPAQNLTVDPDGLHAVFHLGNAVWSAYLGEGTFRYHFTLHENNGSIQKISWAVDDLWVVRCTMQLMIYDLSEEEMIYVGAEQPSGNLVGSFRHGTMLAVQDASSLHLFGVCDWQIKLLSTTTVRKLRCSIINDALYLEAGRKTERALVDDLYEGWAAPLRKSAEVDRGKRFQESDATLRWRWVEPHNMPLDKEKIQRRELRQRFGDDAWVNTYPEGDAIVVTAKPGKTISRGANFLWIKENGKEKSLTSDVAANEGVTNYALTPQKDVLFFVTGYSFAVHRIELQKNASSPSGIGGFITARLLHDVVATDRSNLFAIWTTGLYWHHEEKGSWKSAVRTHIDRPRGNAFDQKRGILILMQESAEHLLLLSLSDKGAKQLASFTDAVKNISLREERLFAQMIDGQWFELEGFSSFSG